MSDYTINASVVEDEKIIARNIVKNIEEINPHFKVIKTFSNGADAWDYIVQQPPHVVFTDISMPIMDGIELASKIYEASDYIKCVVITGYADFTYAQSAIRYGVEDYLLKPVNKDELNKTLKSLETSIVTAFPNIISDAAAAPHTPEEIVDLVKEYVQIHFSEDISLNVIAQNLGFSASYLTKVFNKVENTTPSVYVRNYRMGVAKQLMSDPGLTLNSIAASVGFQDPFHFSKSFKQTFGISPSEYRKDISN